MASSPLAAMDMLPACAVSCLVQALGGSDCSLGNSTCICLDNRFQHEASLCITQSCSSKESLFTKNTTMTACGAPVRDASGEYVVMSNVLAAIIGFSVLQRMASKAYWKLGLGVDDWIIFATTLLLTTPSLVINVHGLVANGMGRDIWTLPFDQITRFGSFFQAMAALYFLQITMIKLTMLFFLLRVFPTPGVRRLLYGTIAFNIVFGAVFVIVAIFQCLPVGYLAVRWDGEHEGKCLNIHAITSSNAAISIAVDAWMLAIPLAQLRSLNLDWRRKIGVGMMFCVGMCFTVVSILRLQVLVRFGHTTNVTWDYLDVSRWSTIEIAIGVICACMPSFRLLLVRLWPRVFNNTSAYASGKNTRAHSGPGASVFGNTNQRNLTRTVASVTSRGGRDRSHERLGSRDGVITCSRTYNVEFSRSEDSDSMEQGVVYLNDLNDSKK